MNSIDQNAQTAAQNQVTLENKLLNASLKSKNVRPKRRPSFGEKLQGSLNETNDRNEMKEEDSVEPTYQSKFVTKMSAVAEKVEEGTQTIRQIGLRKISKALNMLADRVTRLNENLDLNAPLEASARASSKKREEKFSKQAANRGAAKPVDSSSEQSPQAPAQSGAV